MGKELGKERKTPLLRHPAIIVAIIGLIGTIAAALITTWGQRPKHVEIIISEEAKPGSDQIAVEPESRVAVQKPSKHKSTVVNLDIRTDPSGAETYLNWGYIGKTPFSIKAKHVKGTLVIAKHGYRPEFREIDYTEDGALNIPLMVDEEKAKRKILLFMVDNEVEELGRLLSESDSLNILRLGLLREGLQVGGLEETREFQKKLSEAGGLSNKSLLAWARSKFSVDILLRSRVIQQARELSDLEYGYQGVKKTLKGTYRTEVQMHLEAVDARTGDLITSCSKTVSTFSLDKSRSFQEAITKAAKECTRAIRQKIGR